ncbi:MAG: rod shape-determining protein MreD [Pseudomonadota bacterium]
MTAQDRLEPFDAARLARMALLVLLGFLVICVEAMPLGLEATARPSPDLLLCVVACWSVRQPGSAPAVLIFVLALSRDLLTDVPVGAGAMTLLLVSEVLKLRRRALARSSFATEWVTVTIAAAAASALQWLLVLIVLAQPPYLIDLWHQVIYTMMAYPLVAVMLRYALRLSWKRTEVA